MSPPNTNRPTLSMDYDIDTLNKQVKEYLQDLETLFLNQSQNTKQRQDLIDEHQHIYKKKYQYLYKHSNKLFNLAIEYYVNQKNIQEFKEIFQMFVTQITSLQSKTSANSNSESDKDHYFNTSAQIGHFVGNKFGLPSNT